MHVMYFSERPYHPVPEDVLLRNGYWGVPNTYYDPAVASRLYNEYLDEDVFAEQMGFDGIFGFPDALLIRGVTEYEEHEETSHYGNHTQSPQR